MTNDPDELAYETAVEKRDPAAFRDVVDEIEIHLRYGIPSLKFIGWIIIILLSLILWKVWG